MINTQTQIDSLIDLAVIQRTELKQLIESLPQLRDHLSSEIERNLEEIEPAIRSELEQFVAARALDTQAKTSAELSAKLDAMARNLESTTAAKYSVLMAERAQNATLLAQAEARIAEAASALPGAVKGIVTDELARFPRAGEIDQLRKEFAEPRGLNPRGRWQVGETYNKLDLVSYNGDSYVSNIDGNSEKPSRSSAAWTLSAARGNGGAGGGVTSMTDLVPVPANGELLIGNGSAFVNATLTAGTGISISNGPGSITINATDGNITLDDGTAAAPSLNFTNEPTTGLFRASANVMGFAVAGVSRATMTTTGVTVTGTITPSGSLHAAAGSVSNPSIAFNADQNTGLYNIGADNIGAAVGGVKVLDVASTGLTVTGALGASSLTAPATTNLTLAGGSTGASLVLGQSTSGNLVMSANSAERARLTSTGNLLIGGTTDITGSGGLKVFGTTAASSTTSGALQVAGGVGVVGAGYFGGVLNVAGDASFSSGTFAMTGGAGSYGLTISNTSATTRLTTSFGGSSLGFRVNAAGADQLTVSGSAVNIPLTTSASSSIVGALTIGNGTAATNVAIGGGNINAGGTLTVSGNTVLSGSTGHTGKIGVQAAASTNNSGIITIGGSAGAVAGYGAGGISDSSTFTAVANADDFSSWGLYPTLAKGAFTGITYRGIDMQSPSVSGAGTIATHIGINVRDVNRGTANFAIKTGSGVVSVGDSTASTGVGTGALQVAGGIYAGAASYFGGAVAINTTSGLSVTGAGTQLVTFESSVNGATAELITKGKNSVGTARQANMGINRFADDVWSLSNGTTEHLRVSLTTGAATFAGAVAIGNTTAAAVAAPSTHKVSILIGGVQYYLLASNV